MKKEINQSLYLRFLSHKYKMMEIYSQGKGTHFMHVIFSCEGSLVLGMFKKLRNSFFVGLSNFLGERKN